MAHVWNVIDGDIYVSKNGDDVTGDGTMANPYASINKATTVGVTGNKIIIGTGVWQEARGTSTNAYHFIGDGETLFDAAGFAMKAGDVMTYINVIDSGANSRFLANNGAFNFNKCNFYFINLSPYSTVVQTHIYTNCLIKACNFANGTASSYVNRQYYNCVLDSIIHPLASHNIAMNDRLYSSIVINSTLFIGTQDVLQYSDYNIIENSFIYYHNYNGAVLATPTWLQTNGYFVKSKWLNPKFNNPEIGDYTLKPDSPCLFSGKNNTTIGAFGLGYSFDANSSEFTKEGGAVFSQTTLVDDIIRTNQVINGVTRFLFQLASGHASGNVESAWIDLQTIRYLLITRLFANIIYNAAGVATSRPDNLETAGEKAVFYDFELKYCNEESEKATAAWKNVIWNKAVTIDNTGRGNADPAFVASEAQYISARFIKIKLYMTEV